MIYNSFLIDHIYLYNEVNSEEFTKSKKMLTLPLSQLQAGIYFVNLKNSTNLSTTKRWIKL